MRNKIIVAALLLVLLLLLVPSCTAKITQEDYDMVKSELTAAQSQIVSLQDELAEAEILQDNYDELSTNYDTVKSELEILQAKYDKLSVEYNELSAKYDAVLKIPEEISEEDVEQAIFELINQERLNSGLNELEWDDNLYKWAIDHSGYMARENRFEYSDYILTWQDIFWAAGYDTVDRIAEATLIVWRGKRHYESIFMNESAKYGAVAVVKQGEIFYITYFAQHYT